jgi:hypothetical protein
MNDIEFSHSRKLSFKVANNLMGGGPEEVLPYKFELLNG